MATEKIKIKLQGHEKFALREGWINKALQILPENPDAFTRRDATDLFGIGSNMVKSLRYWMRAFGLTNNAGTELSETGRLIAQYDPYLEDSFTLWIMHSYIAKNEEFATTWFMYFNRCDAEELEKSEVVTILSREIKKYVKCHPSKRIFPEEVVLYELSLRLIGNEGISIEEVLFGEKGIVKIYNLSSVMANDYLDRLDTAGYIRVDRTAGLDMIYPVRELNPRNIIEDFYENN